MLAWSIDRGGTTGHMHVIYMKGNAYPENPIPRRRPRLRLHVKMQGVSNTGHRFAENNFGVMTQR